MDREFLIDLFAGFGPVTVRPMFSGFGISADGINFALALRSGLYLRADEQTIAAFEDAGSKPFQYQTRARTMTVRSYWEVPAHLFDDVEAFAGWAKAAFAAAQRAALKKQTRARKPAAAKPASAKGGSVKPVSRKSANKNAAKEAGQGARSGRKGGKR